MINAAVPENIVQAENMTGMILCRTAALLSVLYGIIICAAGSGTAFFAVWFLIGAAFFLLPKIPPHRIPAAVKVFAAAAVLFFVIIEMMIISGFSYRGKKGLDYIIVPGAQIYADGRPSRVLQYRLDKAYEYLQENPDTVCIVSGGKGFNEPFPEAEGMADYLYKKGISRTRVLTENTSENTGENIRNSAALMKEGASAGIITNNFHVYRAVKLAERQKMNDVCGIAARSAPFYLPNNMLREFLSMVRFLITG